MNHWICTDKNHNTCFHRDHFYLPLLPVYAQPTERIKPSGKAVMWTDDATAALHDCFVCTDWQMFRDAPTWENLCINSDIISTNVLMMWQYKDSKIIPPPEAWMNYEVQGTFNIQHSTRKQDCKLTSGRKSGDINEDWRETLSQRKLNVCGKWPRGYKSRSTPIICEATGRWA